LLPVFEYVLGGKVLRGSSGSEVVDVPQSRISCVCWCGGIDRKLCPNKFLGDGIFAHVMESGTNCPCGGMFWWGRRQLSHPPCRVFWSKIFCQPSVSIFFHVCQTHAAMSFCNYSNQPYDAQGTRLFFRLATFQCVSIVMDLDRIGSERSVMLSWFSSAVSMMR
jgi:hypothetical protein